MNNHRVEKPVGTLAIRLKNLRNRSLTQDEVNRLNRVFDKMEGANRNDLKIKIHEKKPVMIERLSDELYIYIKSNQSEML